MAPSEHTKKVLEEFIELYKSHPCLWDMKSQDYHNKAKKEAAYKVLISKFREIEPDANRAAVVRKINNMRGNVRKEMKKYEQSLKSGSADDVYRIQLWYYELFDFLNDQYTTRESAFRLSSSHLDSDDENSCEADNTDSSIGDQQQSHIYLTDNNHEEKSSSPYTMSSRPPNLRAKRKYDNITNELLESVRDHFKHPRPVITLVTEDRCDIIGKNVAMKLKALDARQVSVAEKLINDLLFEAELGHLTPEHAYVNMRDILAHNKRTYTPEQ